MSSRSERLLQSPSASRVSGALVAVGLLAVLFVICVHPYDGVFLLDDLVHIVGNPRITHLTPITDFFRNSSRPLVDLSLAMNYAIGGLRPEGYHAFNLSVHFLAALALYGVVWRSLEMLALRRSAGPANSQCPPNAGFLQSSRSLGFVVAVIWFIHPLQTQSVNYVIQRAESMMGLFYILTLYCVIRGAKCCVPCDSIPTRVTSLAQSGKNPRAAIWYVAAVLSCIAGMLCKTVIVTAPVVVLLFDRAILSASWREVLRRRWVLYVGLAATWGVTVGLGALKLLYDPSAYASGTVGFNVGSVTPWQYLMSQGGIIPHYIRLCFWPRPLVFDYMMSPVTTLADAAPSIIVVAILLFAGVWLYIRRPPFGFVILAFFAILAPTSTFVPVADLCVEHRMYLSIASVAVLSVVGLFLLKNWAGQSGMLTPVNADRLFAGFMCLVMIALAAATSYRNRDYRSELAMWSSVVAARPENPRARSYLGDALMDQGRMDEAIAEYRESIRINPNLTVVENNLANALAQSGRSEEAIPIYEKILARDPQLTHVHLNFALVLQLAGRNAEAVEHYRTGLAADPRQTAPRHNMGAALRALGRFQEAEEAHRTALGIQPNDPNGWFALGNVLESLGKGGEAAKAYQNALRLKPDHVGARSRLAVLAPTGGNIPASGS